MNQNMEQLGNWLNDNDCVKMLILLFGDLFKPPLGQCFVWVMLNPTVDLTVNVIFCLLKREENTILYCVSMDTDDCVYKL